MARCPYPVAADPGRVRAQRGFTLIEMLIVAALLGIMVAVAIPNIRHARIKAITTGQVKQVGQAAMVARIQAIKGGRQTVLELVPASNSLVAWVDDNADELRDPGDREIGRWLFSNGVTVADDDVSTSPTLRLHVLTGGGLGVVFRPNGMTNCSFSGGPGGGEGAFLVRDDCGNTFRVHIQGGAGSVTIEMQDATATGGWTTGFRNWDYSKG